MKKTARCVGAVLAGLAMLSLATVSAAEPAGFETYVVRKGDTLSKIAGRVFGDAKRWREILGANPQVTNANRIYPGDSLLVPVPETAAAAGAPGGSLAASAGVDAGAESGAVSGDSDAATASGGAASPGAAAEDRGAAAAAAAAAEPAPPPARPVAVVNAALYRSAGSIADLLPQLAIVATEDEREMLASGDAAIVNGAVFPGQRFTVVRADRRIFHPATGAYLGWLIQVLGTAEVTCRAERTSTISLSGMRLPASIGDYLVPLDPADALLDDKLAGKITPECIAAGAADGMIVAFDDDRMSVAEQDLAYIDLGCAEGASPGRRFLIYREVAPEVRVTVGELQVLRVGEHTATALITSSVQEVELGDLLRAR